MNDDIDGVIAGSAPLGGAEKRGRGRPTKPAVPPPSWPVITGEMELLHDAFKRGGEVIEADIGRAPLKPATFIYRRA